ncbi:hypothetical protein EYF80_067973 [Liparis tanakae]|uniref:Uncharacterized protein n=1 Tax=Liparis tanakae TaxID=230148 RepID=A0A4Z2DZG2_9TELE|nr:hypothetical protein EYF80_067973 [Liparis tanakae]
MWQTDDTSAHSPTTPRGRGSDVSAAIVAYNARYLSAGAPARETAHGAGEPAKWSVTNLHLPSAHGGKGKIRNSAASNSPLLIPFRAN